MPRGTWRPRRPGSTRRSSPSARPFRVNNCVIEDLIDWPRGPDVPTYQLTLPLEAEYRAMQQNGAI